MCMAVYIYIYIVVSLSLSLCPAPGSGEVLVCSRVTCKPIPSSTEMVAEYTPKCPKYQNMGYIWFLYSESW